MWVRLSDSRSAQFGADSGYTEDEGDCDWSSTAHGRADGHTNRKAFDVHIVTAYLVKSFSSCARVPQEVFAVIEAVTAVTCLKHPWSGAAWALKPLRTDSIWLFFFIKRPFFER